MRIPTFSMCLLGAVAAVKAELCPVPEAHHQTPADGMYAGNRQRAMQRVLDFGLSEGQMNSGLVYLQGASMEQTFYADTERLFRQESHFLYLCQYEFPYSLHVVSAECVLTNTVEAGTVRTTGYLFVEKPDDNFAVWDGEPYTLEELRETYDVEEIHWREDMQSIVAALLPGKTTVYTLPTADTSLSAGAAALQTLTQDSSVIRTHIGDSRAVKSESELELLRTASKVSAFGHRETMYEGGNRKYSFEYQVAAAFRHVTGNCRQGRQAYLTIAPAGKRSSILHYNDNLYAIDSGANDMVLIDAGSEGWGYGSDISRTWPVNGVFTPFQAEVYRAVQLAQDAAFAEIRAGVSWTFVSQQATAALVNSLIHTGLLIGSLEDCLAAGVASTFMPHSLGHHVGIDVHDPGYRSPLAVGMVLTVEPGVYFIDAIFERDFENPTRAAHLNKDLIEEYKAIGNSLGGVRIEDVIVVTETGYELISGDVPRVLEDVEAFILSGEFEFDAEAQKRQVKAEKAQFDKEHPEFHWPKHAPSFADNPSH